MIIVMIAIFFFSSQLGDQSNRISDLVMKMLQTVIGNSDDISSTTPLAFGLSLRKYAHIFVYALLGFIAMGLTQSWWKATLICYAYACLDELHQVFVPGRAGLIRDTLIDAIGFGTVILIWALIIAIRKEPQVR